MRAHAPVSLRTISSRSPLSCLVCCLWQEWTLADATADEVEYPTQFSKFQNVSRLSLFVADNYGADHTRIYYIGLNGVSTNYKREAVQAVYELQANPEMNATKGHVAGSQTM